MKQIIKWLFRILAALLAILVLFILSLGIVPVPQDEPHPTRGIRRGGQQLGAVLHRAATRIPTTQWGDKPGTS